MGKKIHVKVKVTPKKKRPKPGGFAYMKIHNPERLSTIAKEAAAKNPKPHRWTPEAATEAARKGGLARWRKEKK